MSKYPDYLHSLTVVMAIVYICIAFCITLSIFLQWNLGVIPKTIIQTTSLIVSTTVFTLIIVNIEDNKLIAASAFILLSNMITHCITFYPEPDTINFITVSANAVKIIAFILGCVFLATNPSFHLNLKIVSWLTLLLPVISIFLDTIGQRLFLNESEWKFYQAFETLMKYGIRVWLFFELANWLKRFASS